MILYKKTFRVESTRLPDHKYQEGLYFVTICTNKKMQWFGEMKGGRVNLTKFGDAVVPCWEKIPDHFPHVCLDSFVVMPDHVHGILRINSVETQNFASLQKKNKF